MKLYNYIICIFLICFSANAQVENEGVFSGQDFSNNLFLFDMESFLSNEEEIELIKTIDDFEKRTSNRLIIVTTSSLGPIESIRDYSDFVRIRFEEITNNNGQIAVFVISCELRKTAISTNEKARMFLTDNECKEIIEDFIIPEMKEGNYFEGVEEGVNKIIHYWDY